VPLHIAQVARLGLGGSKLARPASRRRRAGRIALAASVVTVGAVLLARAS